MRDLSCATYANQYMRLCRGSNWERFSTEQPPQPEWFAIEEAFTLDGRGGLYAGRDQAKASPFKIYAGKRLIDLK